MRALLALSAVCLAAACSGGGNCPDCCPAGAVDENVTASCRAELPDAGPAAGLTVRCERSDAGAVSSASGDFTFGFKVATCGIATGNSDCGQVRVLGGDGGTRPITVLRADGGVLQQGSEVYSTYFAEPGCRVRVSAP